MNSCDLHKCLHSSHFTNIICTVIMKISWLFGCPDRPHWRISRVNHQFLKGQGGLLWSCWLLCFCCKVMTQGSEDGNSHVHLSQSLLNFIDANSNSMPPIGKVPIDQIHIFSCCRWQCGNLFLMFYPYWFSTFSTTISSKLVIIVATSMTCYSIPFHYDSPPTCFQPQLTIIERNRPTSLQHFNNDLVLFWLQHLLINIT